MIKIGVKLRQARANRNLSLRQLAERADVSASLLSQVENGKVNPSAMSLYNIAAALDLSMDYFFPDAETRLETKNEDGVHESREESMTASEFRAAQLRGETQGQYGIAVEDMEGPILHEKDRPEIELMGGVTWARLTAKPDKRIEFLEITYGVGARSGSALSRHPGREFGLILEGELIVELGFDQYSLKAGDSIIFDSTTPHRLTNPGEVPLRAIWVNYNPFMAQE